MRRATRVLIVDDSKTMRRLIRAALEPDPRIDIIAEASNAREARDAVKALAPDVMTLDVEMPGMSGLDFLQRLMRARPMPVIMLSSMTSEGSAAALQALSLGAVDCVEKPRFGQGDKTLPALSEKVAMAATARVGQARTLARPGARSAGVDWRWNGKWILIGSSTGGVEALEVILAEFPANCAPTLITQHMPAPFLASFAARLNASVEPVVRLAADGERPRQGHIYLAPGGDSHLVVAPDGKTLRLLRAPKRSGHRPSVDMMFGSVEQFAKGMVAVILTGMGSDGAEQMRMLRERGAICIGQDRETCVVYGMPRVAKERGGVEIELGLQEIAGELRRQTGESMAK